MQRDVTLTLTITLADAEDPYEAALRFLAIVRAAPRDGTDLHLTVTGDDAPLSEGHAILVRASAMAD